MANSSINRENGFQARDLPPKVESDFCRRLRYIGRILEDSNYFVWCCSPIYGPGGSVHVYYSRWPRATGFGGWLTHSEIAHAVAEDIAGPYVFTDIALAGRGLEFWDACTVHNPTIHRVADQYALFYMANRFEPCADREQAIRSKRIGVALSNSLYGPWKRMDFPLIDAGSPDSWDEILVSNPSFVEDRNGSFKLYYKGVDRISWEKSHGNRKYGVATAGKLEGPYTKYAANPIIDLSVYGESYECEDAFIWQDVEGYHAIMRDMGLFGDRYGIYMRSHDGIAWGDPQVGYRPSTSYTREPPNGLSREGRFERPQILFRDSKPTHLFVAFRGGESLGSTAAVLEIRNSDSDE